MEFPITDLLSQAQGEAWIRSYFHPDGLKCPGCQASVSEAYAHRRTKKSGLTVYRCKHCRQIYNLYTSTVLQQCHLTALQVVLLLRGVGNEHFDPADPPRRRANKQRGRGTYANDRPPVLGTVGRETGQVRLRVVANTKGVTLRTHAERFTRGEAILNTDEYQSYNGVARQHDTVCHGRHEWARDDDGDGFCEVHCNMTEGLWTDVRNFIRPFKGVHKHYLPGYIAWCEFRRNLKRISPAFISDLVAFHAFYT